MAALSAIADHDDPSLIGPITPYLGDKKASVRYTAAAAILRLSALITEDDTAHGADITVKDQLLKCVRHVHHAWVIGAIRYGLIVLLSLATSAAVNSLFIPGQEENVTPPSLDSILDSLERTADQNTARSGPYEVTREYKVFQGDEPEPISDVTAQINFTPPDTKTFKITDVQGRSIGKTIVRRHSGAGSNFCQESQQRHRSI